MLTWSCERVRGEMSSYVDEELPFADRIAIADHLEACAGCRVEEADLRAIGEGLHAVARGDDAAWMPGLARLQSDVLERWAAEESASLARTIRNLFDDPRRASTSVGISVAASLCLALCAFVVGQSPVRHPESLKAAMMHDAYSRTANIDLPRTAIELPRADPEAVMPATVVNREQGDEVAFTALITSDGRLSQLEYLGERSRGGRNATPATHEQLSQMLNAAATARFEPARVAGAPVDFNLVWLVTHTTVRPPLRAYVHVRVDGWKTL